MDYANFIILLARQRRGTSALRSVLQSHPDMFCFGEVFNPGNRSSDDPFLRETNYFNFLAKYAQGDIDRILPGEHARLFVDFVEYLRCFSAKRYLVVDVKLNMTHFLSRPRQEMLDSPYLFQLIVDYGLKVFFLRGRNYLPHAVSSLEARASGEESAGGSEGRSASGMIRLDPVELLQELEKCEMEDRLVERHFSGYAHYLSRDQAEVFAGDGSGLADDFSQQLAQWLGTSNSFGLASHFERDQTAPLEESIENFGEVARALIGTRFEYCLRDEAVYSSALDSTSGEILGIVSSSSKEA